MSKITKDGLTSSGTGYFIAVPYGNSGRQWVNDMFQDLKLRGRAYVVMGRIGKRLPRLFSADIGLVQSLFEAVAKVDLYVLYSTSHVCHCSQL